MHTHKPARRATGLAALLAGAMSLGLGLTEPASAATIPVTTLTDGPAPGACTLRDAITAANTDTAMNGCPAGLGAGHDRL